MKINIFWFRRDLRLEDNTALKKALKQKLPLLPVFIFDTEIIGELPADDPRISFIYTALDSINRQLEKQGGSIMLLKGEPVAVWRKLIAKYDIDSVFINKDYEPYATKRDQNLKLLLQGSGIKLVQYKDQVIFEEDEIMKSDGKPYTIFTPYRNSWLRKINENPLSSDNRNNATEFFPNERRFPSLHDLGFRQSQVTVRSYDLSVIKDYNKFRDIPAADKTSYLSPHLRFGTVSIRNIVSRALKENAVFLDELIWREFFMQILFHYPEVVTENFRSKYNSLQWRNNNDDFERWCNGQTGYPVVDAGMRQLNKTGYMHNRVRMITAGFLCKHLLIDWRWGEAYFARKLLDYELSSNNGNWQWAAGTGCDAAPYFRIFNPFTQQKKFDPHEIYIRKWIEDLDSPSYPNPMVDHEYARERALSAYKGI